MRRLLFAAPCLLCLAACNPSVLDDAVAKAPVRAVGAPDGYSSRDVGRLVVPLPPPADDPTVAARFVVAATDGPSVAVADFDNEGGVAASSIGAAGLGSDFKAVRSAGATADGRVLLGVPTFGVSGSNRGRVYVLSPQGAGPGASWAATPVLEAGTEDTAVGSGVAAGQVGGALTEDYVSVTDASVTVLLDVVNGVPAGRARLEPTTADCRILSDPAVDATYRELARPVVVANLLDTGPAVAVGVPLSGTLGGHVVLFTVDATGALVCAATLWAPAGTYLGHVGFGTALATGDFDGDGHKDLLVGAPPDRVFAVFGPITTGAPPTRVLEIPFPEPGISPGQFGLSVGAADLVPGSPGDEILVGSPAYSVGSAAAAGKIYVFKNDGSLFTSLTEKDPDGGAQLGLSLTGLPFRSAGCTAPAQPAGQVTTILIAGKTEHALAYFRLNPFASTPAYSDPRCFAGK